MKFLQVEALTRVSMGRSTGTRCRGCDSHTFHFFLLLFDARKLLELSISLGTDHNGSARMVGNSTVHSNIAVASSTLSLIATPTSNASPPASTFNPHPSIHYASGAIHAKEHITVTAGKSYNLRRVQRSDSSRRVACILVDGMLIEPNVAHDSISPLYHRQLRVGHLRQTSGNGKANNWYNTFNTSSVVKSTLVGWPTDLSFHSLKTVLTAESNGDDVEIDFYMDGEFKVAQYGQGFVGSALYLIINLQMEGSSGTPGPKGTMAYKILNVEVIRTGS
ncbi:hypothetical protein ARMGADRAFT_1078556 [Armillaria gallica]|uniref:Concanavalin A-like lectin/glucanase n=1 Tax=Armillaria gallica TaxID=47427 RepID=A0A2H3DHH8_ARMGA|nr:hypothetical protein ARMGADRAFT_1078556 [Armillaria gallica]